MKVLYVHTHSGTVRALAGVDSAVLRHGEPLFVPEPTGAWTSAVVPAVRICRLGAHIRSHVRSYIDAITAFHVLLPTEPLEGIPPLSSDRTFAPGQWLPLGESDADYSASIRLEVAVHPIGLGEENTVAGGSFEFSPESLGATDALEYLSRHMTFKTGDVLLFPDAGVLLGTPELDTRLTASLNGAEVLNLKIK